ncbi:MAG: choice-of-anchor Q domain-containing protein [Anaerolineae bacterium]
MDRRIRSIGIVLLTALLSALGITGLLALALPPESAPEKVTVLYVDDDTCPAVGFGTDVDPYCRLQDAVDAANDGSEIRVAVGSYTGTETVLDARTGYTYTQVVAITKSLALRGGYDADAWSAAPDPSAHPTLIDAQRQGRGISIVGTSTDWLSVTIDGFTITGGDYTGLGNPAGGGWQVCQAAEGADCGGGLYATQSALLLRNSIITDNIAGDHDNSAGGGIYVLTVPPDGQDIRIENCLIANNSALGSDSEGGGIYMYGLPCPLTITRSTLQNNRASGRGGGMRLNNTAHARVAIENTDFISNATAAHAGGGAFIPVNRNGEALVMDRARFLGNRADGSGGAALAVELPGPYSPRARLTNLVFGGNRNDSGPVLSILNLTSARQFQVDMAHITAADNEAPTFLRAAAWGTNNRLTTTLTNTLLVSFTHGFVGSVGLDGQAVIRHANTLADGVVTLHHAQDGSPTFEAVNPLSGDARLDSSYHLLAGSDAIDAGVDAGVAVDIDGGFRPQGAEPDVGADELDYPTTSPDSLSVSGPGAVAANVDAGFSAAVSPITATAPFTYVWQSTDLEWVTHTLRSAGDSVKFEWSTPGDKVITVTASNGFGTVTDTHSVQVSGVPILHISKEGPAEALVGAPITYTLTITNSGVAAAQGLVVTDTVPSGANYVSGGTRVGGEVWWDVSSLAANGAVEELSFVVTATDTIANDSYRVTASGGHTATGTVPVVTVVGIPDLSITKAGPYAANAGDPVSYNLTLLNNGAVAATHLVVTDTIPTGATYISGGTLVGEEVRWTVASLPPNGGETQVSLVLTADQTITNTDYGVIADGGFGSMGVDSVTTIIGPAGTRFVAPHGIDGLNPCTESDTPCATLQHAANVVGEGDEIRVAAGTYGGTQTVVDARTGYTYTQVVFVDKDLTLRGGYDSQDWSAEPDPTAHPTIINAQRSGRGVSLVGSSFTDIPSVTIDGFTITGGDYTGLGNPPGAGWQVCHAGEGVDCGGGLYATWSTLLLRNSIITDNVASYNDDSHGGGLYAFEVPQTTPGIRIENSLIAGNSAPATGGEGGGIFIDGLHSTLAISRSVLRDNHADSRGGGIRLNNTSWCLVKIAETDFVRNASQSGPGGAAFIPLDADGDVLTMDRVRFQDNQADNSGAALQLEVPGPYAPHARLTNLLLSGNRSGSGSVVYTYSPRESLEIEMAHVTAAENDAPRFLYALAWGSNHWLTVTLTNTLVFSSEHAFSASEGSGGQVFIRHTNTLTDDVTALHQPVGGDPTFEAVNPLSGDARLDSSYHLRPGSDAIDAGVDTGVAVDIDGDSRIEYAPPDIGADEFTIYRVFLPLVQRSH